MKTSFPLNADAGALAERYRFADPFPHVVVAVLFPDARHRCERSEAVAAAASVSA
jgi:hypothetical protein